MFRLIKTPKIQTNRKIRMESSLLRADKAVRLEDIIRLKEAPEELRQEVIDITKKMWLLARKLKTEANDPSAKERFFALQSEAMRLNAAKTILVLSMLEDHDLTKTLKEKYNIDYFPCWSELLLIFDRHDDIDLSKQVTLYWNANSQMNRAYWDFVNSHFRKKIKLNL